LFAKARIIVPVTFLPLEKSMQPDVMTQLITDCGFEFQGGFDPQSLVARPEVREMCAADKCHAYNKSWACPPGCGDIEQFNEKFKLYRYGIVFQTLAEMEDEFDFETTMSAARSHRERFNLLVDRVRETGVDKTTVLPVGAGSCTVCPECSYPDDPCRYPEKMFPSMEALGLVVAEVCESAEIPYYHGPKTLAYVSCLLFN
jgi:predicted metal-binding protein